MRGTSTAVRPRGRARRTSRSRQTSSVHQKSYELLCEVLGRLLVSVVHAGSGAAGGISALPCRASAALYSLLLDHPVDRRGRCLCCRRPGALFGRRRRRCRVHIAAQYWLRHPDEVLLSHLSNELGLQTPAAPSPPPPCGLPQAGRPDPDHGGAGWRPDRPRPRRDPPDDLFPPHPGAFSLGPDVTRHVARSGCGPQ